MKTTLNYVQKYFNRQQGLGKYCTKNNKQKSKHNYRVYGIRSYGEVRRVIHNLQQQWIFGALIKTFLAPKLPLCIKKQGGKYKRQLFLLINAVVE